MKTKFLAIAALGATLIGGGAFFAGNAMAQSNLPSPVLLTQERHPEIRKAMRQLNNAMDTMRRAADDFHGHKKAAMDLTSNAIKELQAALRSDRH